MVVKLPTWVVLILAACGLLNIVIQDQGFLKFSAVVFMITGFMGFILWVKDNLWKGHS